MATENKLSSDFTKSWRYKVGLFMIIAGNGALVVGLLLPIIGVPAKLIGALILGGEIVSLASIVFLGKEGFKAIKSKIFGFFKAGYAASVGRVRHYVGIILLCTNVLTTFTLALFAWASFKVITPENPIVEVWGLNLDQQATMVMWLFLIGEISFLVAIYVLGADWWGKFRNIFIWTPSEKSE